MAQGLGNCFTLLPLGACGWLGRQEVEGESQAGVRKGLLDIRYKPGVRAPFPQGPREAPHSAFYGPLTLKILSSSPGRAPTPAALDASPCPALDTTTPHTWIIKGASCLASLLPLGLLWLLFN